MFSVVERMLYTDMQDHAEARDCEALAQAIGHGPGMSLGGERVLLP